MKKNKKIIIGTRGSRLALWQANWVKSALIDHDFEVNILVIKTKGDKILDVPLAKVGGKGLFVKEIEQALITGEIDVAVHSMKDMPAEIPPGLCIGAVPERETTEDVLISRNKVVFSELKIGARIGTSSLRRSAQILNVRDDIKIDPLRGNIETRLKKLETENLDAVILAGAGVKRLNLENRITEYLDEKIMLPAVAQGALCIEIREDDPRVNRIVSQLNHEETRSVVMGERSFLKHLGGSCQVPVAGHGKIENNSFTICGLVAEPDGSVVYRETLSGPAESYEEIGIELADQLLKQGAGHILERLSS
jgi:hydroxymethylbilane synthase